MAKTFERRRAGLACGFRATGGTEDGVVSQAVAHARRRHGLDLAPSQTLERHARSAVRDDSRGRS